MDFRSVIDPFIPFGGESIYRSVFFGSFFHVIYHHIKRQGKTMNEIDQLMTGHLEMFYFLERLKKNPRIAAKNG